MKPWDAFKFIKNADYTTSGEHVDWTIKVDSENNIVYLVFQETSGKVDWRINFDFKSAEYIVPGDDGTNLTLSFHRGWANAWNSCDYIVTEAFIKEVFDHNTYKPWLLGWSYGGSMTMLPIKDYHYMVKKLIQQGKTLDLYPNITGFGVPKPIHGQNTMETLKAWCGPVVQMFCHSNDIVTKQPPSNDYCRLDTTNVGTKHCIIADLNPWYFHTGYDKQEWYKGIKVYG
jgi:hypothetical protein